LSIKDEKKKIVKRAGGVPEGPMISKKQSSLKKPNEYERTESWVQIADFIKEEALLNAGEWGAKKMRTANSDHSCGGTGRRVSWGCQIP